MPCSLELDNPNLKDLKLIPNFHFDLDNIEISLTPYGKNTTSLLGRLDDLNGFNVVKIYILDNSYFFKNINESKNLNISGVINGNKPSFINKKLVLLANNLEIEKKLLNIKLYNN